MNRFVTFVAVAVLVAATAASSAQQRLHDRPEFLSTSAETEAVTVDAYVGAIRAVLNLTSAQERHWPVVEDAIRRLLTTSMEEKSQRREDARSGDIIAKLRLKNDVMANKAAGLRRVLDAAEPLGQSLDEAQKRRLTALFRMNVAGKRMIGIAPPLMPLHGPP